MAIDATFWVAISFVIFIGVLVYFKIPQKVSQMLDGMISDIKNEIDESEKLRTEAKTLLDNAQKKLDTATTCLLYTSPSPRDAHESRMPSSA